MRYGSAFGRICLCICMSVSVCPFRDLTFESFDLEIGAPAVPGKNRPPRGCQEHKQWGSDNCSGGNLPLHPGNSSTGVCSRVGIS